MCPGVPCAVPKASSGLGASTAGSIPLPLPTAGAVEAHFGSKRLEKRVRRDLVPAWDHCSDLNQEQGEKGSF